MDRAEADIRELEVSPRSRACPRCSSPEPEISSKGAIRRARPAARPTHERLHVLWPVVQRGRVEIGTVRPYERMDLGIEPDLALLLRRAFFLALPLAVTWQDPRERSTCRPSDRRAQDRERANGDVGNYR